MGYGYDTTSFCFEGAFDIRISLRAEPDSENRVANSKPSFNTRCWDFAYQASPFHIISSLLALHYRTSLFDTVSTHFIKTEGSQLSINCPGAPSGNRTPDTVINGAEGEIRTHDCQAVKPGLLPLNYPNKSRALPSELMAHIKLVTSGLHTFLTL